MTRDHDDGAWFAPKRFGYGSSWPIRWQGWIVMLVFAAVAIGSALALEGGIRIAVIAADTMVFMMVSAAKTRGGWKWRWGRRD